jgi:predicted GIY-YIG superfamily endonuclease
MIREGGSQWRYPTESELRDRIQNSIVPQIQQELTNATDADCPTSCLCHNVDNKRIAEIVKPFSDLSKPNHRYTVYVLECKPRAVTQKSVREEFKLQQKCGWAQRAQNHSRLLYVGVSQNVVNRLKEHASAQGSGANFTQIFPATRVLSIEWFRSKSIAYKAEEMTADALDKATSSSIYVSQPG